MISQQFFVGPIRDLFPQLKKKRKQIFILQNFVKLANHRKRYQEHFNSEFPNLWTNQIVLIKNNKQVSLWFKNYNWELVKLCGEQLTDLNYSKFWKYDSEKLKLTGEMVNFARSPMDILVSPSSHPAITWKKNCIETCQNVHNTTK